MAGPGRPRKIHTVEGEQLSGALPSEGVLPPEEVSAVDIAEYFATDTSHQSASPLSSPPLLAPRKTINDSVPGANPIVTAPLDGTHIELSPDGTLWVLGYRRKTRKVNKTKLRYEEDFRWTDVFTRMDLPFDPKFWRPKDFDRMYPIVN